MALIIAAVLILPRGEIAAGVDGDADLLNEVADAVQANSRSIVTWKGIATQEDEHWVGAELESKRLTKVEYAFDANGNRLWFLSEGDDVGKAPSQSGRMTYAAIRSADSYTMYGPLLSANRNSNVAVRPVSINRIQTGWLANDFDPFLFEKIELASSSVPNFCHFYFEHRNDPDLTATTVELHDATVKVRVADGHTNVWEYHFRRDVSCLPVYVQGGNRSGDDVVTTWKSSYRNFKGIWIPNILEVTIEDEGRKDKKIRRTTFAEQRINEEINPAIFDVTALPLRKGDRIYNPATGNWTRFE